LQLEKDLTSLTPGRLGNVGPNILKRIAQIEARFSGADEKLQTRLRAEFQNRFSWALRALAEKGLRLPDKQLRGLLELCERLLDTSAGRDNALEAIGLALSKKRKLGKRNRELLKRVVGRQEPGVVEHFGFYLWAFLKSWPEFVWDCLDRWTGQMGEDEIAKSLSHTLSNPWFWWLFRVDKERALKLLQRMLHNARQSNRTELVDGFLSWFAAVAIEENESRSRILIETILSEPEIHGTETAGVVRALVGWLMPRDSRATPADKVQRASDLAELFFNSALAALQRLREKQKVNPEPSPKEPPPWVKAVAHQFDQFATEIRFSAESHVKTWANKPWEDFKNVGKGWWDHVEPLFKKFEKWLHPHLGSELISALAAWFPYYPERCLHWLRRFCQAGMQTGLLFERLVVTDIIKILRRCLVERRDLLGSDKIFLQDFAAVLEALLSTANVEALGMAASLDEFYR
jgi:hypothetical protein